jgi:hypothetical protein
MTNAQLRVGVELKLKPLELSGHEESEYVNKSLKIPWDACE